MTNFARQIGATHPRHEVICYDEVNESLIADGAQRLFSRGRFDDSITEFAKHVGRAHTHELFIVDKDDRAAPPHCFGMVFDGRYFSSNVALG